ncbi:outer membrane biogenesis protein BamB [Symmachiella macrocystis]|uniref:Outer membrane biogenesis protein BamB n=1 Tax=Symmachiella macrocystis TaxID=2527985 RepID=A0A5C6BPJ2_9PLAN|nr:PQQ-binding-like beta-propeller repeat protein [Symmachiella macrocystis]TWU13988.1 outer membrane biogenesis protein BamB [Symmachiella macrocystis]
MVSVKHVLVCACLTSACCVTSWAGENWPNYRGPSEQGLTDAENLPLTWGEDKNITWQTPIEGKAWSTPVIWGDQIWMTSAPLEGNRLRAICVDKKTGKIVHDKMLYAVAGPQYCHPFNSYASPSPVIEEGRVYVSFGSPYNACLDTKTGKVIWERDDFVCNHFRGPGSSPFLYKNLLILHFDGSDRQYVVALDKQTGDTVWETERTVDFDDIVEKTGKPIRDGDFRKAFSTPMIADVDGRPMLISLGSKALYAYDPETGEELWRLNAPGVHSGSCRPALGHGLVYMPMGSGGKLWAVNPNGSGELPQDHIAWEYKQVVPRRASPLLVGDLLFVVDDGGIAACIDAKTGEGIWRKRLGGNFSASPIYADGKVYFFDEDGKATVIEAAREYRQLAVNKLGDGFMASPAVSGDSLFLRSRSQLYRIDAE